MKILSFEELYGEEGLQSLGKVRENLLFASIEPTLQLGEGTFAEVFCAKRCGVNFAYKVCPLRYRH
jgi:hypothetical protein